MNRFTKFVSLLALIGLTGCPTMPMNKPYWFPSHKFDLCKGKTPFIVYVTSIHNGEGIEEAGCMADGSAIIMVARYTRYGAVSYDWQQCGIAHGKHHLKGFDHEPADRPQFMAYCDDNGWIK